MTEDEARYLSACESMIVSQDRFIAAQAQLINTLLAVASARLEDIEQAAINDIVERHSDQTIN